MDESERERPPPWTLAEGLRTSLGILVRRSTITTAVWLLLLILLGANAEPGPEPPPPTALEVALGGEEAAPPPPRLARSGWRLKGVLLLGAFVGWGLTRRLVDRVGFTGLPLRSLALGVAWASIGLGTLLALPFLPDRSSGPAGVLALWGGLMAGILVWIQTADD